MVEKVVLAYSGGLDTSVAIAWLQEQFGVEVIAVTVDVGQDEDLTALAEKAKAIGAVSAEVIDAKDELTEEYLFPALQANAIYEGVYPLSTALARPLIVKHLVAAAHAHDAGAVAHGCTGKGNDQVRFEVGIAALDPLLKVLAPARTWGMTREQEIDYAQIHGIPTGVTKQKAYSVDANLWGRSVEGGRLEDPTLEPSEDAFLWTTSPILAPPEPQLLEIVFDQGVPVKAAEAEDSVEIVRRLNRLCGRNGIGRIDHVESRVVGIKSREVYECPAATVLIAAHRALEALTLPKDVLRFKSIVETRYAELVYDGLWYTPLRECLQAFVAESQARVTGRVSLKLYKGSVAVVGRDSPNALYDHGLATYGSGDAFDASAAEGFVKLWGLPSKVWAQAGQKRVTMKKKEVTAPAALVHGP